MIHDTLQIDGFAEFTASAGDTISLANNLVSVSTLAGINVIGNEHLGFIGVSSNADTFATGTNTITSPPLTGAGSGFTAIYVDVEFGSGVTITSITDSDGGLYTLAGPATSPSPSSQNIAVYYRDVVPFSALTVTVTFSGNTNSIIGVVQLTGTAFPSLAPGTVVTTSGTSNPTFATLPLTAVGQFMFAAIVADVGIKGTSANVTPINGEFNGTAPAIGGADAGGLSVGGSQTIQFDYGPATANWAEIALLINPIPALFTLDTPNNAGLEITLLQEL